MISDDRPSCTKVVGRSTQCSLRVLMDLSLTAGSSPVLHRSLMIDHMDTTLSPFAVHQEAYIKALSSLPRQFSLIIKLVFAFTTSTSPFHLTLAMAPVTQTLALSLLAAAGTTSARAIEKRSISFTPTCDAARDPNWDDCKLSLHRPHST